jgi:acyl-ACP thioesterase
MKPTAYLPVWRETFRVHSSDIGYHGRMRVGNVCRYLQEVAGRHAEHLDVGYTRMRATGLAWVLSRLTLEIERLPLWGQEFFVETWPVSTERILFRREYRLGCGDEIYAAGSSYWIPLDLSSRRPKRVEIDRPVLAANEGRYGIQGDFIAIPAVTGTPAEECFTARYSDLDQNHHVNNTRYVEWVFDHLGLDVPAGIPRHFSIEYKQEIRPGESMFLCKNQLPGDPASYVFEGRITENRQVGLRARVSY